MHIVGRRRCLGRTGFRACIAAVICGFALGVPSGAVAVPRCFKGQLALHLANQATHGGHKFWYFGLRNTGPGDCKVEGYPSARLLGATGNPLAHPGAGVIRAMGFAVQPVVLPHGQSAFFTFAYAKGVLCPHHHFPFHRVEFDPPSPLFYPPGPHPPPRNACPNTVRVSPFRTAA
jgi:hypothetical protein